MNPRLTDIGRSEGKITTPFLLPHLTRLGFHLRRERHPPMRLGVNSSLHFSLARSSMSAVGVWPPYSDLGLVRTLDYLRH